MTPRPTARTMKPVNLRGWTALVTFDGRPRRVVIVTHIRGETWMVESSTLPVRCERAFGGRRTTVSLSLLSDFRRPRSERTRRGPD